MDNGYTIVVGDRDMLSVLCGVNDGNLRAIEDYLGAPVVTRGNELTIASSDAEKCRKFQNLVDTILGDERLNCPSPEMIESVIAGLEARDEAFFIDSCIEIPHSTRRIFPKSARQAELIQRLRRHEVVFCLGPAGTGKTFLAIAEALRLVLSRNVRKIVLTRPVVEAGESLGFLPGDLEQKINPYLRPLYDAMETLVSPETLRRMDDSSMIEIAPLAYMRGRSIENAVIILDEAQNATREQMKMFLTRLGSGSRAIITGDPSQVDLPGRVESGLAHAVSVLGSIPEIAIIRLETGDVVRNSLVRKIVQAYEQEKK